jgi:hypothetical protein
MSCGFWRAPPRRPVFAGRVVVLLCTLVYLFAGSTAPAQAYVCSPGMSYTPRVAAQKNCDRPRPAPAWRKNGDADAMSFVFFIGAVCAVLLIPVAFGRREELPPE